MAGIVESVLLMDLQQSWLGSRWLYEQAQPYDVFMFSPDYFQSVYTAPADFLIVDQ